MKTATKALGLSALLLATAALAYFAGSQRQLPESSTPLAQPVDAENPLFPAQSDSAPANSPTSIFDSPEAGIFPPTQRLASPTVSVRTPAQAPGSPSSQSAQAPSTSAPQSSASRPGIDTPEPPATTAAATGPTSSILVGSVTAVAPVQSIGGAGTRLGADSQTSNDSPTEGVRQDLDALETPSSTPRTEVPVAVPFGAKVPVAAVDDEPRTPQQQAALDRIMDDFYADVEAGGGSVNNAPPDVWEASRQRADERYRILFGDAAYNAYTMQAALDALQEKREQELASQQEQ